MPFSIWILDWYTKKRVKEIGHLRVVPNYTNKFYLQKSVNLQYNMLIRLANGTNDSSTKRLMFQVLFFFIKSCKILCKNLFIHFLLFYKDKKMKVESFECPKSIRNYEKKYWERQTLVPSAQQSSVLYCRLSDSWTPSFGSWLYMGKSQ